MQATRHLDSLFRDLGSAIYDQHAGRATSDTTTSIERLYGEIEAHEGGARADAASSWRERVARPAALHRPPHPTPAAEAHRQVTFKLD